MSVLTKKDILEKVKVGEITFKPALDVFQVQTHAIDLRLGFTFLIPKTWHLTAKGRESVNISYLEDKNINNNFEVIELEQGQYFELLPNEYVVASTLESIKIPNDLMAILYPRSSTNRRGLSVDLTGIVDAGYEGQLTIPIRNNTKSQTIRIYPGERFCQIVFEKLTEAVDVRKSRYHQKDIIEGFIKHNETGDTVKKDETEIKLILSGDIKKIKNEYKAE